MHKLSFGGKNHLSWRLNVILMRKVMTEIFDEFC